MADEETVQMSAKDAEILRSSYNLLNKLYTGEKAMDFKKMLKTTGYKVPELDVVEQASKPILDELELSKKEIKALREDIDNDKKSRTEKEEEAKLSRSLESIQKEYGFDDAKMEKVKARMFDMKNPDAESAAAWVASKEPKAKLTTNSHNFGPASFNGKKAFAGDGEEAEQDWKMLMDDARNGTTNHLNKVADEIFNQDRY